MPTLPTPTLSSPAKLPTLTYESFHYTKKEESVRSVIYRCKFYRGHKCKAKLYVHRATRAHEVRGEHVCRTVATVNGIENLTQDMKVAVDADRWSVSFLPEAALLGML